jgi:hypothetical protein
VWAEQVAIGLSQHPDEQVIEHVMGTLMWGAHLDFLLPSRRDRLSQ